MAKQSTSKPKPTENYIFISYAREDQAYARNLAEELHRRGYEAWMDDRIDYGSRWWRTIVEAIGDSIAFVVVMTPEAEDSKWVEREIILAEQQGKPIFPLLLHGHCFPIFLTTQYLDVTSGQLPPDEFYEQLKRVVPQSKQKEPASEKSTEEQEDNSTKLPPSKTSPPKPKEEVIPPKPKKIKEPAPTSAPAAQPRLPPQEKDTVTKDEPATGAKTGTGVGYLMARVAGMLVGALVGASCCFLTLGGLVAGIGEGYFGFGQDSSEIGAIFVLVGWTIVVGLGLLIGGFGGWSIIRLIGRNRLGNR